MIGANRRRHQPGQFRGPLFSTEGSAVGVNTAIASPSGSSVGIGFAITADLATRVAAELRAWRDTGGWLSVELAPNGHQGGKGAQVMAVQRESPAARAGLKPGDVI